MVRTMSSITGHIVEPKPTFANWKIIVSSDTEVFLWKIGVQTVYDPVLSKRLVAEDTIHELALAEDWVTRMWEGPFWDAEAWSHLKGSSVNVITFAARDEETTRSCDLTLCTTTQ